MAVKQVNTVPDGHPYILWPTSSQAPACGRAKAWTICDV